MACRAAQPPGISLERRTHIKTAHPRVGKVSGNRKPSQSHRKSLLTDSACLPGFLTGPGQECPEVSRRPSSWRRLSGEPSLLFHSFESPYTPPHLLQKPAGRQRCVSVSLRSEVNELCRTRPSDFSLSPLPASYRGG
ncbi:hypothetical protein AAFF_G00005500 [Aldrovandia affinis]|uniref:Uncharacterized protein n=1 Tax=Aldrovandia affinis TaxID=143900 RepID=A0AAD7X2Y3_9TELE|nr:hypothetical protein AAFF_G00005500 [Aldrovandia affinis]